MIDAETGPFARASQLPRRQPFARLGCRHCHWVGFHPCLVSGGGAEPRIYFEQRLLSFSIVLFVSPLRI